MMPDLGDYGIWIGSAWLFSLGLLIALVAWIWWRSLQVRRQLEEIEARRKIDA